MPSMLWKHAPGILRVLEGIGFQKCADVCAKCSRMIEKGYVPALRKDRQVGVWQMLGKPFHVGAVGVVTANDQECGYAELWDGGAQIVAWECALKGCCEGFPREADALKYIPVCVVPRKEACPMMVVEGTKRCVGGDGRGLAMDWSRRCANEDQVCDPVWVGDGIFERQKAAIGMTKQGEAFVGECACESVEVGNPGGVRILAGGGSPRMSMTALVEEDDLAGRCCQVEDARGMEVGRIDAHAAVETEERTTSTSMGADEGGAVYGVHLSG